VPPVPRPALERPLVLVIATVAVLHALIVLAFLFAIR